MKRIHGFFLVVLWFLGTGGVFAADESLLAGEPETLYSVPAGEVLQRSIRVADPGGETALVVTRTKEGSDQLRITASLIDLHTGASIGSGIELLGIDSAATGPIPEIAGSQNITNVLPYSMSAVWAADGGTAIVSFVLNDKPEGGCGFYPAAARMHVDPESGGLTWDRASDLFRASEVSGACVGLGQGTSVEYLPDFDAFVVAWARNIGGLAEPDQSALIESEIYASVALRTFSPTFGNVVSMDKRIAWWDNPPLGGFGVAATAPHLSNAGGHLAVAFVGITETFVFEGVGCEYKSEIALQIVPHLDLLASGPVTGHVAIAARPDWPGIDMYINGACRWQAVYSYLPAKAPVIGRYPDGAGQTRHLVAFHGHHNSRDNEIFVRGFSVDPSGGLHFPSTSFWHASEMLEERMPGDVVKAAAQWPVSVFYNPIIDATVLAWPRNVTVHSTHSIEQRLLKPAAAEPFPVVDIIFAAGAAGEYLDSTADVLVRGDGGWWTTWDGSDASGAEVVRGQLAHGVMSDFTMSARLKGEPDENGFTVNVAVQRAVVDNVLPDDIGGSFRINVTGANVEWLGVTNESHGSDGEDPLAPGGLRNTELVAEGDTYTADLHFQWAAGNKAMLTALELAVSPVFAADPVPGDSSESITVTTEVTLSLALEAAAISENGGSTQGTITRTGSTAAPLTVNLAATGFGASSVSFPASVTIAAGSASATFDITGIDDAQVNGTRTATITTSADGATGDSAALQVRDDEEMLFSSSFE